MFLVALTSSLLFSRQGFQTMGGIIAEETRRLPSQLNRSLFIPKIGKHSKFSNVNQKIPIKKIFQRTGLSIYEFRHLSLHIWRKLQKSRLKPKTFQIFKFMLLISLDALWRGYDISRLNDIYSVMAPQFRDISKKLLWFLLVCFQLQLWILVFFQQLLQLQKNAEKKSSKTRVLSEITMQSKSLK